MTDKPHISVSQDELDELLASMGDDDSPESAFAAGLRMRKQTIVSILEDLDDDTPADEHVSQNELDDLMDTSDTVKMSKAEIVDTFGRAPLQSSIASSKIMPPNHFHSLSLEPPSPKHKLLGGAQALVRKLLPTRSRNK